MNRLARKFESARKAVPQPVVETVSGAKIGFIAYGTSHWATTESRDQLLEETDVKTSYFRLRAYPFTDAPRGVHRQPRARLRHRAEPRRPAAAVDAARADAGAHRRSCAASCTTAVCRSTPAASPTTCWRRKATKWRRKRRGGSAPEAQAGSRPMATPLKVNRIGLEPSAYKGGKTTLCAGCGHNSISERIIEAFYEMGVDPERGDQAVRHRLLEQEPGVLPGLALTASTAVHGRMPSVGTGAMLANKNLIAIGVSGDGDTGAIGIGQFVHLMRRNLPYRLHHRRQRLLRPDQGAVLANRRPRLEAEDRRRQRPAAARHLRAGHRTRRDLRGALVLRRQEAAAVAAQGGSLAHRGTVMLDVISPCVTFNDHEGSTKSYAYVKEHDDPVEEVTFVPFFEDITVEYEPGTTQEVTMHDGSKVYLKKLEEDYDADRQDRRAAAAARDGAPRRVRDRPHLRRARSRRLPDAAERGRRIAGQPAARTHAARQGSARRDHGVASVITQGRWGGSARTGGTDVLHWRASPTWPAWPTTRSYIRYA